MMHHTSEKDGCIVWNANNMVFGSKRVSCTECTGHGNDSELIPTTKMETRHPIEGSFGSEFLVICNHCGVMAARSLKTRKCAVK